MKKLIKTEIPTIYRDPENKALIIKESPVYSQLVKKIYELERKIQIIEKKLNNIGN